MTERRTKDMRRAVSSGGIRETVLPEFIVFINGALVMILEMTGSRVLAPHLGASLVVWTSLIGVVLAFMALGAWFGGRTADRCPSTKRLGLILLGAGATTAAAALMHPSVGAFVVVLFPGLHSAAVAASALLLGVPAALFGMVTPFVIRLRLQSVGTSGRTVGRLYALSTAGSIVGTFFGGFVLIAWFGSTQILFGISAVMTMLAAFAVGRPTLGGGMLFVCLSCAAMFSGSYGAGRPAEGKPVLVETPYNALVIREGRTAEGRLMRVLATDPGKSQAAVYPEQPDELAFPYTRLFAEGAALPSRLSRVLMLGGGGYSMARWLLRPKGPLNGQARLDVVELDPGMTRVAQMYFGIPDDRRLRIFHEDARRFLNRTTETYDLIYVDVFGSEYSVPFHVGTVEAARELRRCTAPGGVVMVNVISALEGEKGRLFQAVFHSLQTAFPHVESFAARPSDGREAQNVILVALTGSDTAWPPALAAHQSVWKDEDIPALTDDYAPVERYALSLFGE